MAIDWLQIKTDYLKDPLLSLDKVAERHGQDASYVRRIAAEQKWKEEKDALEQKVNDKLTESLPETIAQVKLRHARRGRILQDAALRAIIGDSKNGIKPLLPTGFGEASNAIVRGVTLERQALGMNDKEIQDEVIQKFQAFTFIFHLKDDELLRFIANIDGRGKVAAEGAGTPALPTEATPADNGDMGTSLVPERIDALTSNS